VKGAAVSEEQAQPLTGKARHLANLKLFAKGQLANKTGAGRAGRPVNEISPEAEEVRREPASGGLDDLAPNPAGWTTSTPMTRPLTGLRCRGGGNSCIDRVPDEVAPDGKALERALERAREFDGLAPLSTSLTKAYLASGVDDVLDWERSNQAALFLTADHAEGETVRR
jgi:hypothetical protein